MLYKGNGQAITEESPKDILETDIAGEVLYAEPLTPEEIRWFYKDGVDKRWIEFCGYDSLRIEKIYQDRRRLIDKSNDEISDLPPAEKIVVKGGMYDVEIDNMKCVSIYWPGDHTLHYLLILLHHNIVLSLHFRVAIHLVTIVAIA